MIYPKKLTLLQIQFISVYLYEDWKLVCLRFHGKACPLQKENCICGSEN